MDLMKIDLIVILCCWNDDLEYGVPYVRVRTGTMAFSYCASVSHCFQ